MMAVWFTALTVLLALPVVVYYCVFLGVRAKRRAEKHNP